MDGSITSLLSSNNLPATGAASVSDWLGQSSEVALAVAGKTKRPDGVPDTIERILPNWQLNDKEGKNVINAVAALFNTAAKANPRTFDFKRYANDLKAAEKKFDNLVVSDVLKKEFASTLAKARKLIPKAETRPPDLPVPANGRAADKDPADFAKGNKVNGEANIKKARRGNLVDTKPYVLGTGTLDRNPAFERVVGTSNAKTLPVYQIRNNPDSYLIPIDLKKFSLIPTATRSNHNYSPKGVVQPNPLYNNETVADFAGRAASGKVAGIDPAKFLGAFNASFFNSYGPDTTLSHASLVNGKVTSTGKIEDETKMAIIWDNNAGSARVERWTANDNSAPSYTSGPNGGGARLASPDKVAEGFGSAVGKPGANGFIGFDPLNLPDGKSDKRGAGTFVGVNAQGQMAVLVSSGSMTPRQAHRTLSDAGYKNVVALDSGPSSQLSMVTNRKNADSPRVSKDTEPLVGSLTNRGVPMPISIQSK